MVTNFVRTFFPWFIFFLMTKLLLIAMPTAITIALSLFLLLNWQSLKKRLALTWIILLFFIFILINIFVLKIRLMPYVASSILYGILAAYAFLSLVVKRPFTTQYAKLTVPAHVQNTPQFRKTNRLLSLMWAVIFSIIAVTNLFIGKYAVYFWAVYAFSVALIILGIFAAKYFPRWYAARKTP